MAYILRSARWIASDVLHQVIREGDTVILSPACTSYDAFRNFEERGDCFASIIRELPEFSDDGGNPCNHAE